MTDDSDHQALVDSSRRTVAVRLQGGLGDHILGMRVLRFVRGRYPLHEIVVYSDSGGYEPQLQIAAMSPYVSRVVPVYESRIPTATDEVGKIDNLRPEDQAAMLSSDCFVDAFGRGMFAAASISLDVPIVDILAHRPEFIVSAVAETHARGILRDHVNRPVVSMNLTKWGVDVLRKHESNIRQLLKEVLEHQGAIVLNIFPTCYQYGNWHEPQRTARSEQSRGEAKFLAELCSLDCRVIPCVDLPLATIVALLKRSCYFIGVDNGIKHIAWALQVPRTYFHPIKPSLMWTLRWMPDLHRMLLFDCTKDAFASHRRTLIAAMHADAASKAGAYHEWRTQAP